MGIIASNTLIGCEGWNVLRFFSTGYETPSCFPRDSTGPYAAMVFQ